jgi:hypothetical protein
MFDIKLGEGFWRKASFVAGFHMTETPESISHSSVVSCVFSYNWQLDARFANTSRAFKTAINQSNANQVT